MVYPNIKKSLEAASRKTYLSKAFPQSPFIGQDAITYDKLVLLARQHLDCSMPLEPGNTVELKPEERMQSGNPQFPVGVNMAFAEAPKFEDVKNRDSFNKNNPNDYPIGAFIPNPASPGIADSVNLNDVNNAPFVNIEPSKKPQADVKDTPTSVLGLGTISDVLLPLDTNADSEPTPGTASPSKRSLKTSAITIGDSYKSGFAIYQK